MKTTNKLPMLMSIKNNDNKLFSLISYYYESEQIKFGRSKKQIAKDLDQLTCIGTCSITSIINVDNTNEGRNFFIAIENKYKSIYNN